MMVHIFYHNKDLDGHCSGAIAKYYHLQSGTSVVMHPYDYGEPFPFDKVQDGLDVWMVDITSSPYEVLLEVRKRYNLFVIDHHKSFIESEVCKKIPGVFVNGTAACELTWNHCFPDTMMPNIVHRLAQYDIWDNKDKNIWDKEIMPHQMGIKMYNTDPSDVVGYGFWKNYFDDFFRKPEDDLTPKFVAIEDAIRKTGTTIIKYQGQEDDNTVGFYSFPAEFEDMRAICLNSARFNSQVFKSVWDNEKYDIMLAWVSVKGDYYKVSLYTDKEGIDVSNIAKRFGGGGHKQAAGFICHKFSISKSRGIKFITVEP
jgi:oligoribonuclease NrnB/cAMP/cGMP phosphodiesterase (DHH superfamily)